MAAGPSPRPSPPRNPISIKCPNFLGADLPPEELDEEMVLGLREHFLSINGNATVNKKLAN